MLVTDRRETGGRDLVDVVEAAVGGGVGLVQVRERDLIGRGGRGAARPDPRPAARHGGQGRRQRPPGASLARSASGSTCRRRIRPSWPAPRSGAASVHDENEAWRARARRSLTSSPAPIFPTGSKPGHPGDGSRCSSARAGPHRHADADLRDRRPHAGTGRGRAGGRGPRCGRPERDPRRAGPRADRARVRGGPRRDLSDREGHAPGQGARAPAAPSPRALPGSDGWDYATPAEWREPAHALAHSAYRPPPRATGMPFPARPRGHRSGGAQHFSSIASASRQRVGRYPMPDVQAEDRRSALGWVKHIGDLRDGLLVGATFLYGLGYFVWSLNAWMNNLGILPLIESQYLVTGVVPALILWLGYLGVRPLRRLMDYLPSWIGPGVKGWKLVGRLLTVACFWGSFAVFFGIFTPWFQDRFPEWTRSGLLVSSAILVVTTVLYSGSERKTDLIQNLYANVYTYFIPFGLAVVAIFAYVAVHRTLPHEFGGARPRCAYLDVTRAKMSDESLRDVVPADAVDGQPAGRTIEQAVRVLFRSRLHAGQAIRGGSARGRQSDAARIRDRPRCHRGSQLV